MYPIRPLLFVVFFHVIFVNGTTIPLADLQDRWDGRFYAKPCPDGLPGRVTQIQEQSLARPAIFITDCSPSRNNTLTDSNPFETPALDKRQEQLCSADCTNQCASSIYPASVAPLEADCTNLLNQVNSRNTQFTVSAQLTVTITYGTCLFQVDNLTSSPIIYCYTDWAARSQSLIDNCFPQSGGTCQGTHFLVVIAVNYPWSTGPTTTGPAPAPTTATTTNGNGTNTSSSVNGDGNASNSNSASGNTAHSNAASSSSGTLSTSLNGSQGRGSGSHTTTVSNGSASLAAGVTSETGDQQSSTSSANIPAIVGAVLGLLSLLALIILILLWRRKKRAQRQLASLEGESSSRESLMARAANVDPRLHPAPALGSENGAVMSETPMTEAVAGAWAASHKARMYTDETMPGTRATDRSPIEPSAYTRKRRIGDENRNHPHPHAQQVGDALNHRDRDAYASDNHPTLTGSSNPMSARAVAQAAAPSLSESGIDRLAESIVARMQGGDSALQERIVEEAGSSNSMSARTFARAAAPNLSAGDIDRLAESIVARMQGRDPEFLERIVEEAGSSVITEDEPPPPWSAPVVIVHGL